MVEDDKPNRPCILKKFIDVRDGGGLVGQLVVECNKLVYTNDGDTVCLHTKWNPSLKKQHFCPIYRFINNIKELQEEQQNSVVDE
jgi:hypothetical protein